MNTIELAMMLAITKLRRCGIYRGSLHLIPLVVCPGGFAALQGVDDYTTLLQTRFADIPCHWIPGIAAQAHKESPSPAGNMHNNCVFCDEHAYLQRMS